MLLSLLQFPIPPPINNSFSSHHRKKQIPLSFSAQTKNIRYKENDNFAHSNCINPNSSPLKSRLVGTPKCAAPGIESEKNQTELGGGLDPELMPKHVAVIADGNRRWAQSKGLTSIHGYEAGIENMKKLALHFNNCGVETVSLYLFAREYCWYRPKKEVEFLMKFAQELIQTHLEELMRYGVRLTVLGDTSRFPQCLQDLIHSSEERAKNNNGPRFVMAADYSGRYDITEATKKIATKVKDGALQVEDINETLFQQHLHTNGLDFPNPDLLIRTGNKFDVGNYMLWQLAYTELYFSEKMFPDFHEEDVIEALATFQRRQRRFGGY